MKKQILSFLIALLCTSAMAMAQHTITGTVTDAGGEPVIGASVNVQGSTEGTVTDFDGKFTLPGVASDATISISYVGMATQDIKVDGRSNFDVVMKDDNLHLDEIVVIGYGSAKAKDLTAPITTVSGADITNIPSSSPMGALAGKVPGVNVINSGAPGAGPTVQIRGIGSFTAASPLYVVDGMFYDDINWLNNDDIQELSILKDASAAAIYGVKAANGVVLVTTKKGFKNQKAKITYNGYVGMQKATHLLKMCNSHEYAQMLMDASPEAYSSFLQASVDNYGGNMNDLSFNADTDWYDQLLRTAVITNHNLNISGGGERATYSLGMSYLYQNGIMKADNDYERLNFRAQIDYDATNWLKVGFNGVFSNSTQNNANSNAWQQAFNMPSIMPVYDFSYTQTFPEKFASPELLGFTNNFYNPVATAFYNKARNRNYQAMTNFFADFTILPQKLDFKTSYGYDYASTRSVNMGIPYYVSNNQHREVSELTKEDSQWNKWVWDNILTYKDKWGRHGFGAMVGYSMRQDSYHFLKGTAQNVPYENEEWWYLSNGNGDTTKAEDNGTRYRSQSVFTRLNYDFDSRYLLMFTFRADGSSKYQEKWGYFPSVGAAWNISNEEFMQGQTWADFLKLRASWGLLGNDKVSASDGFASITTGNGASGIFGSMGSGIGTPVTGFYDNSFFSWLRWEKVAETNVGLSYQTLNGRLSAELDWFYRLTTEAVISPSTPIFGNALAGNWGKILNTGVDLSVNWNDRVGDFKYYVGANLSTLRNRVKALRGGLQYIIGGRTINMVGERMNSFYGYEVEGVYQTEAEIQADPVAVANGLEPGDFKYRDQNGDGSIDGNDRVTLGSYLPSVSYGLNFGFSIRNFDFAISTYGQAGAKMFNRKRQLRYAQSNYNFDHDQFVNRWTGPGSTNEYPSAKALTKSWNVSSSATATNSYFVESADFFRIQNITLGYTFQNIKMGSYTMPGVRLSLTADRPFSFFKANTFSPELTGTDGAEGWDTQVYPLSSTFTFGVQLDF